MATKILMVDDEKDVVQIVQKRLSREGFEVFTAYDGQEGYSITKDKNPDLIVTDVVMPIMNGFDFCKAVKNREESRHTPIIVLTAKANMEDAFLFLGIKDFLCKPFKLESLEDTIRSKLGWARIMDQAKTKIMVHASRDNVLYATRALFQMGPKWIGSYVSTAADLLKDAVAQVPEIILVDLLMQDMPAKSVIEQLRQQPVLKNTIILTYYAPELTPLDGYAQQARIIEIEYLKRITADAGAQHYLGPFNHDTFLNVIDAFHKGRNA